MISSESRDLKRKFDWLDHFAIQGFQEMEFYTTIEYT